MDKLIKYVPCQVHDVLLFQWFSTLCSSGEIEKLFLSNYWTLSKFFEHVASLDMVFRVDDKGIWFWASYAPMLAGAQFDMWIRPDHRQSKASAEAMAEALEAGFERWPVLIGMTTQENLLDAHRRMGYTVVGKVPGLWQGKDLWIMHITKEAFDARELFIVRRAS